MILHNKPCRAQAFLKISDFGLRIAAMDSKEMVDLLKGTSNNDDFVVGSSAAVA